MTGSETKHECSYEGQQQFTAVLCYVYCSGTKLEIFDVARSSVFTIGVIITILIIVMKVTKVIIEIFF
jgi:hypothetical protein